MHPAKRRWSSTSLNRKVLIWIALILLVMLASSGGIIWIGHDAFREFDQLQTDYAACYAVQEAIEAEQNAFADYIREASQENQRNYRQACADADRLLHALPTDSAVIGLERSARTWNLVNGYEGYAKYRDAVVRMDPADEEYVELVYQVKDMQEHLSDYALRLVQTALESGNRIYSAKAARFTRMPGFFCVLLALALVLVLVVLRNLSATVVRPLLHMAQESRRISENDFTGEDLPVESADEIGELTVAFNRMKQATAAHISTLEALHREEVAKLELEKNLNHTRLEMLKSQVNPHFLFNSLNMISCMARLEEAPTTDRMIVSLGNLFRYNLRTKDQEVFLDQELEALEDYIYIQKMRFDNRIVFRKLLYVDPHAVKIPSFLLQPVVENAFSHGLKNKRSGGRILLRIWQEQDRVILTITDNGRGMDASELAELSRRMDDSERTGRSIGLGNIQRRIAMLYPEGSMHIYSRPDRGTIIRFAIPQTSTSGGEDQ